MPNKPGKREADLRYMSARLLKFEQIREMARELLKDFPGDTTLAEIARRADLEIDNFEYCLSRDRKNQGKPD